MKEKKCSFCGQVGKLWFSKPPTCMNGDCRRKAQEQRSSVSGTSTPKRKDNHTKARIQPISDKKAAELKLYRKLRDSYLTVYDSCEAKVEGVCHIRPVELHHLKPRAYHLCDTNVFMAVCRSCHNWIERNDGEARKLGLKLNHL